VNGNYLSERINPTTLKLRKKRKEEPELKRQMSRASNKGLCCMSQKGECRKPHFFSLNLLVVIACRITATTFCSEGGLSVINSIVFKK
jgi:hypothetical protein